MSPELVDAVLFHVLAAVALVSALAVVLQRHALHSAFALIVTLCSLAAIFGLLGSPFIAALQVIVYAGAIMVLFVFVVMLLNVQREEEAGQASGALRLSAWALALLFTVEMAFVLRQSPLRMVRGSFDASTRRMAEVLFSSPFLYPFEATSVLILAAMVGAVLLAKKEM